VAAARLWTARLPEERLAGPPIPERMPSPPPDAYHPAPLNVSSVELDPQVAELSELLARNVHDVWARARFAEGWTYGPTRDDSRKTHPCLVSYDALPDSEREYDRHTVHGTLKAMLALGYRLVPPAAATDPGESAGDDRTPAILRQLQGPPSPDLQSLVELWRAHTEDRWAPYPELYRRLASRLIERGSPLLANDAASEGLRYWKSDVRLRQLQALALAKSGAPSRANTILMDLKREGHLDAETLGILARTHKDLAETAKDPPERERQWNLAHQVYLEGFRLTGSSYPGVNAATTALLLGKRELAMELARQTRDACMREYEELRHGDGDVYYALATLGEVALILGDESEAERWYREATSVGQGRLGDLSSTRRNARLIANATGRSAGFLESLLKIPKVVVFAGHLIDRPGRPSPRFPPEAEARVKEAIADRLGRLDAGFGYSSAACGGDILFLEAMAARQGRTNLVLPYAKEQFAEDSVAIIPGGDWETRFARVLEAGSEVVVATAQRFAEGAVFYEYANLLLLGLASLHARVLDTELVPLVLWDGETGDGAGGTATTVEEWRRFGYQIEVIDLRELVGRPSSTDPTSPARNSRGQRGLEARIMAVIFADVVHFSSMGDLEIKPFVDHFLGAVADLISGSDHAPVVGNTWGDGLYFVFKSVRDAGLFGLDLCDLMAKTDWAAKGLRPDLNLRVALHAGPLLSCTDPILKQRTFTGKHVVPAARLEPVTPPGMAYASREFAALAAAERVTEFSCQPVGRLGLAKHAGTIPVYVLSRAVSTSPVSRS
jgi:hypothetical protein